MPLVRARSLSALVTLALGAGAVAGAGAFGQPASADEAGAAPTGTYNLDTTSIWAAQNVVLTQTALSDDGTPAEAVQRTVAWGDGTTETLPADATSVGHAYPKIGSYPVSVTLRDAEGNEGPGTLTGTATVSVTATPGTYKLNRTTGWTWRNTDGSTGQASVKLSLSGVPATVTRVWVSWGDGNTSLLKRTTASTEHRYPEGRHKIVVTPENGHGKAAPKTAGTFATKVDTWAPATVTLKVPKSPTNASSWKTVTGTVKDNQIGAYCAWVSLVKHRTGSSTYYYFKFSTKKWARLPADGYLPTAGIKRAATGAGGKWKISVSGLTKGNQLQVMYTGMDKAGNESSLKRRLQKLTK